MRTTLEPTQQVLCDRRLNIAFIGTLPPHPGGSAIANRHLLAGCAKLGHKIRALAPITADVSYSGDAFAANHPEMRITRFVIPYHVIDPVMCPPDDYRKLEGERITETLSALIGDERPDVIIIGRAAFTLHVPQIAKVHSIPCVLIVHGATAIGILTGTYPRNLAQDLLDRFAKVDLILTPAAHMGYSLQQLGFNNVTVIPNAVDPDQFFPQPKERGLLRAVDLRDDEILVLHASNMKMIKRPLDIVSSAERCLRQNPNLMYVIVGDGPCRDAMEEACRSRNLLERFRFLGWVDYSRMPDYINIADIVVMPSEAETQALVYLETQACGRLLLASDIPGAREVVSDGETGLLFTKGDIGDLTAKILLAAADPKLRADIGRRAREYVTAKHSVKCVAAGYVRALEQLVLQRT